MLALGCSAALCASGQDAVQAAFLNATDHAGIQRLYALAQRMDPNMPRTIAFQGAATAMLAEVDASVWAKWKHCRDGMHLLDRAVDLAPRDAEVRFLRFVVADATPGFLGFRKNVHADAEVVIQAMEQGRVVFACRFWKRAFTTLLNSDVTSPAQRKRMESIEDEGRKE